MRKWYRGKERKYNIHDLGLDRFVSCLVQGGAGQVRVQLRGRKRKHADVHDHAHAHAGALRPS